MTADLVAVAMNIADQLRIPLRHPAEHEERAERVVLSQQSQQRMRVGNHSAFKRRPLVRRDLIGEGGDVKVVFHIDRHRVPQRPCVPEFVSHERSPSLLKTVLKSCGTSTSKNSSGGVRLVTLFGESVSERGASQVT